MKLSDLKIGQYFQFVSDRYNKLVLTYCVLDAESFHQIDKKGVLLICSFKNCEVVRVDIETTENKDKETREALKTEIIKVFDAQRSSICRCVLIDMLVNKGDTITIDLKDEEWIVYHQAHGDSTYKITEKTKNYMNHMNHMNPNTY